MKKHLASKKPRMTLQQGFTLIEIMIAAFVLAIGLLGVGALNLRSLKNNADSINRTQAVLLAYDMADRIRANAVGTTYASSYATAPATVTDCANAGTTCTKAELQAFDVAQWKCQLGKYVSDAKCIALAANDPLANTSLENGLPNGDGAITRTGTPPIYKVSIRWFDPASFPGTSCPAADTAACQSTFDLWVRI